MKPTNTYNLGSNSTTTFSKTIDIALDKDVIVEYLPLSAKDGEAWLGRFNDNIHMFRYELLNLIDTIVGDNTNCRIRIPEIELLKLQERIENGISSDISSEEKQALYSKSSRKINRIIADVLAMYPGLFEMQKSA